MMHRIRTILTVGALALTLSAGLASSSAATPANPIFQGGKGLAPLAVDGNVVYGVRDRYVDRIDATTSLTQTIYVAPRGWAVDYLIAGGGNLGIQLSKVVKGKIVGSRAVFYNSVNGATRTLGSGAVSAKRKYKCGTEVSVTDVTPAGEAVVVRSSYSLSRKLCRKPVNVSTSIRGLSWSTSRVLFTGNIRNSRVLGSLGGIVLVAELRGDKLIMTGDGVGVFDLPTQQFALIKPASRSAIVIGRGDRNANALILGIPLRGTRVKYEMLDAASGYTNVVPIETTTLPVVYMPCGDYLVRTQFATRQSATSQLTVVANPLIPAAAPNPDQLIPSGEELTDATCDANSVVFETYRRGTPIKIWRAPLSG